MEWKRIRIKGKVKNHTVQKNKNKNDMGDPSFLPSLWKGLKLILTAWIYNSKQYILMKREAKWKNKEI